MPEWASTGPVPWAYPSLGMWGWGGFFSPQLRHHAGSSSSYSLSCSGQQRAAMADETRQVDAGLVPVGHLPCAHTSPSHWPQCHKSCPCTVPWEKHRLETPRVPAWELQYPWPLWQDHSLDDQGLLCAAPAETSRTLNPLVIRGPLLPEPASCCHGCALLSNQGNCRSHSPLKPVQGIRFLFWNIHFSQGAIIG